MIIVGQDERCITEKLDLYIKNYNLDDGTVVYMIESDELRLAKYETEERAKEVLKEITEIYQANKLMECCKDIATQNQITEKFLEAKMAPFKYEMPKE